MGRIYVVANEEVFYTSCSKWVKYYSKFFTDCETHSTKEELVMAGYDPSEARRLSADMLEEIFRADSRYCVPAENYWSKPWNICAEYYEDRYGTSANRYRGTDLIVSAMSALAGTKGYMDAKVVNFSQKKAGVYLVLKTYVTHDNFMYRTFDWKYRQSQYKPMPGAALKVRPRYNLNVHFSFKNAKAERTESAQVVFIPLASFFDMLSQGMAVAKENKRLMRVEASYIS